MPSEAAFIQMMAVVGSLAVLAGLLGSLAGLVGCIRLSRAWARLGPIPNEGLHSDLCLEPKLGSYAWFKMKLKMKPKHRVVIKSYPVLELILEEISDDFERSRKTRCVAKTASYLCSNNMVEQATLAALERSMQPMRRNA